MEEPKLKPCPFCGSIPQISGKESQNLADNLMSHLTVNISLLIQCYGCGVKMESLERIGKYSDRLSPYKTREQEVTDKWNSRYTPPT